MRAAAAMRSPDRRQLGGLIQLTQLVWVELGKPVGAGRRPVNGPVTACGVGL
jgi:hypothetical protein